MRVLVSGATGFVGAALLRALRARGHETVALVRAPGPAVAADRVVVWDLAGPAPPGGLPRDLDAVVHGAQSRRHRAFPGDAPEMYAVNAAGAWSLLHRAAEAGVARACLLSTGSVYEPYEGPLRESAALAPAGFLGASKLAGEVLARGYAGVLALSVLRLFFPYGPGQADRLVPDIARRVREGAPVQLARDGEGLRFTPTLVDDVAAVIVAAVEGGWTGTYNVASPALVSLRELAEAVGRVEGRAPVLERPDRDAPRIAPCLERLRARYDLAAFTPLEDGLRATLARAGR